jgi:2-polyprenyl-6-methoxyphenol hydroxylase-like FAD-dependent oxidoreductase
MTRNSEALVIGGGPVGLFAALSLLERGVSVEVFDAEGERAVRGYACGLHPETLRTFGRVGLMPSILDAAHRVDRVLIRNGAHVTATAEFGALGGPYPYALTLRQFDLEELLQQALERQGVKVRRHHAITHLYPRHGCVTASGHARLDGTTTSEREPGDPRATRPFRREADFVIGADGYFSACRRALGADLTAVRPARAFAVCEFNADLRKWQRDASVTFAGDGVNAYWPLGSELGRFTFQVWEDLDQPLTLERVRELIRQRAPWFAPNPEQLCWGGLATFEHRLARRFGEGRIWLAGDAAHSTSPIGFQSMNRGFCEGDELSRSIARALFEAGRPDEHFEQFEHEQQAEWLRLFGLWQNPASLPWDPSELAPCIPASGADFEALVAQLGPPSSAGALLLH